MAYDDQDDLFSEDFDFVDEDEFEGGEFVDSELEDSKLEDSKLEDNPIRGSEPADPTATQDRSSRNLPGPRKQDSGETRPTGPSTASAGTDNLSQSDAPSVRGKRRPLGSKSAAAAEQPSGKSKTSVEGASIDTGATPDEPNPNGLTDRSDSSQEDQAIPAGPPVDHVVHVYELSKFKRTIQREFTAEDAEAFAVEYNRTSRPYGRVAVAAGREQEPVPTI